MNLLSTLTTSEDIGGEEKDTLGGGGSRVLDSDAILFNIDMAYLAKSDGGALGMTLWLKAEDGRELRTTMYLTNRQGQNYYLNKDQEKMYLPGFNMANSLSLLTTGKPISELEPEKKMVSIYNFTSKAEVPTSVDVITDFLGQKIYAGVIKQKVDKTKKDEATNTYVPTGETREQNEIDKFFCARDGFDKMTSAEIKAKRGTGQEPEKLFFDGWLEKWKGQVQDKSTGAAGTAGKPGAKPAAAAAGKPSASLFG